MALDYVFQAGRALEYEANRPWSELVGAPDPDSLFAQRDLSMLIFKRDEIKDAYDVWGAPLTPHTYVTDDPYPKILLSRAMGYVDTMLPGEPYTTTAQEQFNAYVVRNPANRYMKDGAESLRFTFGTSIHQGNPFFASCLFNDRILSVKLRIRGQNLGQTSAVVNLGWGDVRCQGEGCGSTFIRSQDAFADQDASGYIDDLHAYQVQPKLAYIEAVTGDTPFPLGAGNEDLATRSVHNPLWTFNIDMSNAANASLILDNIDDVELIITHEAYSLQAGYCAGRASAAELPPTPAYQPMQRVLDPESSPLLGVQMGGLGLAPAAGAAGLTGRYAGAVAPVSPQIHARFRP